MPGNEEQGTLELIIARAHGLFSNQTAEELSDLRRVLDDMTDWWQQRYHQGVLVLAKIPVDYDNYLHEQLFRSFLRGGFAEVDIYLGYLDHFMANYPDREDFGRAQEQVPGQGYGGGYGLHNEGQGADNAVAAAEEKDKRKGKGKGKGKGKSTGSQGASGGGGGGGGGHLECPDCRSTRCKTIESLKVHISECDMGIVCRFPLAAGPGAAIPTCNFMARNRKKLAFHLTMVHNTPPTQAADGQYECPWRGCSNQCRLKQDVRRCMRRHQRNLNKADKASKGGAGPAEKAHGGGDGDRDGNDDSGGDDDSDDDSDDDDDDDDVMDVDEDHDNDNGHDGVGGGNGQHPYYPLPYNQHQPQYVWQRQSQNLPQHLGQYEPQPQDEYQNQHHSQSQGQRQDRNRSRDPDDPCDNEFGEDCYN